MLGKEEVERRLGRPLTQLTFMNLTKSSLANPSHRNGAAALLIPHSRAYEAPVKSKAVIPIANEAFANRDHDERVDISGTALATRHIRGFRVIENRYARGLELSAHFHENAFLVAVLEGTCSESYGGASTRVVSGPGSLRYLPPRQEHSNRFEAELLCLIVEIEPDTMRRVQKYGSALERPCEIQSAASAWLVQRLYQEFRRGDPLALVAMEGILLEILADVARHAGQPGPTKLVPRWLRTAREYLEANFLRSLSLAEVAGAAGVHRVHLSREFRRHFSTTVGEFVRRKRVEHACQLVSNTNEPLADIAMSCGFSDQSHFSATFRRQLGLTPGRFRHMAQSR